MTINEQEIYAIERPHPRLLWLYIVRSVLTGPGLIILMPLLIFRYITLRYRFDPEGIHMRWGLLFRNEVNLTYARIQDIHMTSGLIQRWFGLSDLQIQTASGSTKAEMTIEGMLQSDAIRDFLYTRMRGYRVPASAPISTSAPAAVASANGPSPAGDAQALQLLSEIVAELRATREALERRSGQ